MATFRQHFPSKQDIISLFAVCVFVVYSWSIVAFLDRLPSWLLYQTYWDLLGVFAYGQIFALLDSLLPFVTLIILSAILPARFLRDRIVALGGMAVIVTTIWSIAFQSFAGRMTTWPAQRFLMWGALYLLSLAVGYSLIRRFRWLETFVNGFADRVTILMYLYMLTTAISIIVIIVRNL